MVIDQSGGSAVADRIKVGASRAKDAAVQIVNPAMLGDFAVVGHWLCERDNGLTSLFTLDFGGKGIEQLLLDAEIVSIPCEWRREGRRLIIESHGDRKYTHHVYPDKKGFGFGGHVTVGDFVDSEFSLTPYR